MRTSGLMKPLTAGLLSLVVLWAMSLGVGEIFENAAHLVQESHAAHDEPNGDDHSSPGPEHGCAGLIHLCRCCPGQAFLSTSLVRYQPDQRHEMHQNGRTSRADLVLPSGLDHPPKA